MFFIYFKWTISPLPPAKIFQKYKFITFTHIYIVQDLNYTAKIFPNPHLVWFKSYEASKLEKLINLSNIEVEK